MKLSIITINYNNAEDLERTIKSVVEQTWQEFEFIVIDGGSTDGSLEIIKRNQESLTYWVSERDNGVFHAMNKGILKARGEYLLMLNSGDILCDEVVLANVFEKRGINEDIVYGDVFRESKGKIFAESIFPDHLTFLFLHEGALSHQATFIRKDLHDKIGLYDETLKFSSDWSFVLLAICKHNASYRHLPFKIATCNCDGLTCNPANLNAMTTEGEKILRKHFPAFFDDYIHFKKIQQKQAEKKISFVLNFMKTQLKSKIKIALNNLAIS